MKIFISHATADRWAARRISKEIEDCGATTFLDEKDIETEESIDDAISKNLADCDEVLVLLSPASIKSEWVLVEVGGAKALKKRLVPILFYLSVNDIPSPISKQLARDINNIERYYDELRERIQKGTPPPAPVQRPRVIRQREPKDFKIGDKVRIPTQPQNMVAGEDLTIGWSSGMDEYLGQEAEVIFVDDDDTVRLDIDNGGFWWESEWLQKIT